MLLQLLQFYNFFENSNNLNKRIPYIKLYCYTRNNCIPLSRKMLREVCGLCERSVAHVSLHHLVPREEGGRYGETIQLCQPCHSTIHLTFDNKALAKHYYTVEKLRQAPLLQKYLNWIRGRSIEKISNRRRRR